MRRLHLPSFLPALFVCLPALAQAPAAPAAYPDTGNFGVPFSEGEDWYRQCMRVGSADRQGAAAPVAHAPASCDPGMPRDTDIAIRHACMVEFAAKALLTGQRIDALREVARYL